MSTEREQFGQAASSRTVMVVDDDENLREAITLLLERHGHTVLPCAHATEALRQLEAGATPMLILLDLMMPHVDGWSFRVAQKREPRWASIPVIAMSADHSAKAAAIDAQAFLAKPFDEDELLGLVRHFTTLLEREQLEARAREIERLSSLGVLAAGVAQEVNDPLSFVLGNLELAEQKALELEARLNGGEVFSLVGIRQLLTRAHRGAERIGSVVQGVSVFAAADTQEVTEFDPPTVLESSLQLVSNELRHVAQITRSYAPVSRVVGNPAKLGQVFLNLLLNSLHAIREGSARPHEIRISAQMGPDRTVVIEIADTGRGIPPELLGQIFDPFFATKLPGLGRALGLSVSLEVVTAMGGNIEVESHPSQGSTFRVVLPSHTRVALVKEPLAPPRAQAVVRRRPRVLVIDDEPLMCELLEAELVVDYEVVAFTDSRAAMSRLLEDDSFDLVLCDMMMPGVSGMELFEHVISRRPELEKRFVFITGGPFSDRARVFLSATRRPQIRKPFRHQDLIDVLEAQLATKH